MTAQTRLYERIRSRMETAGDRYATEQSGLDSRSFPGRRRMWASEPELSDDALRERTGQGWDDWCDVVEAWPSSDGGHTAIATYLRDERGVDAWWAQTIAVGYERIVGLRLPYQRPDGTFTANKSMTVGADADLLRTLLLDEEQRRHLFPGEDTSLRSKPASKAVRLKIGPGVAVFSLEGRNDKTKVTIGHEELPTYDDVAQWKFYWSEWLRAFDDV